MLPSATSSASTRSRTAMLRLLLSRVSVHRAILAAVAVVFLLGAYLNLQLLSSSSSSATRLGGAGGAYGKKADSLTSQLTFETRHVAHLVFTSGCSERDMVQAEVLAHSARSTGFTGNLTHLVYGCEDVTALMAQKNPELGVETLAFPEITSDVSKEAARALGSPAQNVNLFGEDLLTTTIHPAVVQRWLLSESARYLDDKAFVMLVDSDAIFTKRVDIWSLFAEVEDIQEPRWFGQDASWYHPQTFPLTPEELQELAPSSNSPILSVPDWREYAATGPYVMERAVLSKVLPEVNEVWGKMSPRHRYMAFPLAAAHHGEPIGISGVLSIHNYPSRYENWDFADDVHHNPCNESSTEVHDRDVNTLASYPISLRGSNFSLPQWIDGRPWSFVDTLVPRGFLTCDSWLLREPSGHLWYLASHTNGYERVPTILRRRHTISVCLAVQAYNAAALAFKKQRCPLGFNANKKVPIDATGGGIWGTAHVLAMGTSIKDDGTSIRFGDYEMNPTDKKAPRHPPHVLAGQLASEDVHFVFVTSCGPEAQWQSDVLAHSFARVHQRGRLTRIVTGCARERLAMVVARSALYPHLNLFVTQSYAFGVHEGATGAEADQFERYNHAFGLRDWLHSANPPVQESVLVLLEPSFVFLRAMAINSGARVVRGKRVHSENYKEDAEIIEGLRQYKRFFVYEGTRPTRDVTDAVEDGVAIAQRRVARFGALGYEDAAGAEANLAVCPQCTHVTAAYAQEYYAVGAPYILTLHDLEAIVDDYCSMLVQRREMDRQLEIVDVVALALASAKQDRVKFTAFGNLAISRGDTDGQEDGDRDEYWGFLSFIKINPCGSAIQAPMVVAEAPLWLDNSAAFTAVDKFGLEWTYDRTLMPDNLFTCDAWLLAVPPASVWTEAKRSGDAKRMQHAYGLCTSIKTTNEALVAQKTQVCENGFNANRKLRLVSPRPANQLRIGDVHEAWVAAADEITAE